MTQQTLRIQGMTCAACQIHVQRALESVPGVTAATVNLMARTAAITSSAPIPEATLAQAVRNAGYDIATSTATDEPGNHLGLRATLALLAGAAAMVLSMPVLSMPLMMAAPSTPDPLLNLLTKVLMPISPSALMHLPPQPIRWFLAALSAATILFAAPQIYIAAWRAARHHTTNMNTLIALGTLAAFASSLAATIAPQTFARHGLTADVYYEAVILILAFLLAGRWLEARARHRATSALRAFAELEPADARLLTPAPGTTDFTTLAETVLPLSALETGDIVRVLPGDRTPVDGLILQGRSSIDESMLTGEPLPITRNPGDTVTAGTLNLDGPLTLRATAVGAASTLAQMQRLLAQAQSSRAPMQRLADRASAIFVPAVLALAAGTFLTWSIFDTPARAFAISIAVLIIACPCAMGLAVPAAITVAIGRAAQCGFLIKGGETLERLATIDTIALDKTGTLTLGQPTIAAFTLEPTATLDKQTLLPYAAAAERLSTHPLAQAVVTYAASQAPTTTVPLTVEGLTILPGIGLAATVNGHALAIGNATLLPSSQVTPGGPSFAPSAKGGVKGHKQTSASTPLYLILDNHHQATFYATDQLRPTAPEALTQIRALNITPILLTGDTLASASPIANQLSITDIRAHLLPTDKLQAIQELQQQNRKVAMAGDGINDAAALAQADAGIAMFAATGLAREAADILLLHPDLRLIPTAIALSRRATRIMRQNLGWAVAYNALGLPIAAGALYPHFHILLSPILASAAMALSSVSVLLNSLRLRRLP